MDIQETISRVRKEYKDYLREKHPDWAESSLSTHVSDAFYLYQNTIALSFWKCFESDESMAAAKQDILEYLKHDVMSERAEERTAGYFNDLKMLKEFLDTKGGVRAYVGPEYDCEVTVQPRAGPWPACRVRQAPCRTGPQGYPLLHRGRRHEPGAAGGGH